MNTFTVLTITIDPAETGQDLLISELGDIGFDGFLEEGQGFEASIGSDGLDPVQLDAVLGRFREAGFTITVSERTEADRNWNEEWEKNFDPVEIGDLCRIRAPFHEKKEGFRLEVTIMPRMSFGTGHHATTAGMIRLMMTHALQSPLLDMGSGTAVLAIVARKLGIADVTAIDIDDWAFDNAPDNCALNGISDIKVLQGDAALLGAKTFGTIIANINRNVLLEDIPKYVAVLEKGGSLFLSGFYSEDFPMIQAEAEDNGLTLTDHVVNNNWVAAVFSKG
ncbi:MAG: 50S ribosomal protein L11 methyltransferase [Flavobacteriales bacterium]|nr:50S ribosomal protein L11 methyltransferase [Flavobacteriales bacterium]